MKIQRLPDHSYFRTVDLVIGSDKELDRWLKQKDPKDAWTGAGRWTRFGDRMHHYVLLTTSGSRVDRIAVLAHELLHLTFQVLHDVGLTLAEESEEAFTYYFQGMLSRALKHIG